MSNKILTSQELAQKFKDDINIMESTNLKRDMIPLSGVTNALSTYWGFTLNEDDKCVCVDKTLMDDNGQWGTDYSKINMYSFWANATSGKIMAGSSGNPHNFTQIKTEEINDKQLLDETKVNLQGFLVNFADQFKEHSLFCNATGITTGNCNMSIYSILDGVKSTVPSVGINNIKTGSSQSLVFGPSHGSFINDDPTNTMSFQFNITVAHGSGRYLSATTHYLHYGRNGVSGETESLELTVVSTGNTSSSLTCMWSGPIEDLFSINYLGLYVPTVSNTPVQPTASTLSLTTAYMDAYGGTFMLKEMSSIFDSANATNVRCYFYATLNGVQTSSTYNYSCLAKTMSITSTNAYLTFANSELAKVQPSNWYMVVPIYYKINGTTQYSEFVFNVTTTTSSINLYNAEFYLVMKNPNNQNSQFAVNVNSVSFNVIVAGLGNMNPTTVTSSNSPQYLSVLLKRPLNKIFANSMSPIYAYLSTTNSNNRLTNASFTTHQNLPLLKKGITVGTITTNTLGDVLKGIIGGNFSLVFANY